MWQRSAAQLTAGLGDGPGNRPPRPCSRYKAANLRPGRRQLLDKPAFKVLRIIFPNCLIADLRDERREARFKQGSSVRRIDPALREFARPQQIGHGPRTGNDVAQRFGALAFQEIVRILAFRQQDESQRMTGTEHRKGKVDRSVRGLDPCLIAIEAQQGLGRSPPQQAKLIGGERGTERRDAVAKAGAMHGDHVHIAFDRDDLPCFVCGPARLVHVVEHAALLEERRLR